ncbi:MAG: SoxR reducing system RseC family protein [Prevotellaceae bacterium]|jgi:sigma-E factor negative regulatory protein RseC|nr:SoxR reducing system RseC family protein [Prevotellaceae bacterium]
MNKNVSCSSRSGIVSDITPENIAVNIISMSACAGCHAKELCSAFERKEKAVFVPNIGQRVQSGDKVAVVMQVSMGLKAVLLAYVLPLIFVLMTLLLLLEIGTGEFLSGAISLSSLMVYYFVIFLIRNKLKKQFSFFIEKID